MEMSIECLCCDASGGGVYVCNRWELRQRDRSGCLDVREGVLLVKPLVVVGDGV